MGLVGIHLPKRICGTRQHRHKLGRRERGVGITAGQAFGLKFYIEARYHYSPQGGRVSTQVLPVTMGIRW